MGALHTLVPASSRAYQATWAHSRSSLRRRRPDFWWRCTCAQLHVPSSIREWLADAHPVAEPARLRAALDCNRELMATRVALATLWDGTEKFRCAFPLWCRSARRFGEASQLNTSIVVLKPSSLAVQWRGACAGMRSHGYEDVAAALQSYVERHAWLWYVHHYWRSILKLAIFALTDFDAVPSPPAQPR